MARVTRRDHASSLEVASRYGVMELGAVLKARRLRWFGHVLRRDETEILGVRLGLLKYRDADEVEDLKKVYARGTNEFRDASGANSEHN